MKARRIINGLVCLLLFTAIACSDIFVENITDSVVTIIAPADSVFTYDKEQSLLWEPVNGATEYRLLIFTPDQATASSIVVDTTLTATSFKAGLPPASYEWCITASNGAYTTASTCNKLIVLDDLSDTELLLLAPGDGLSTSTPQVTFSWEKVPGATGYHLRVASPDFDAIETMVIDTTVSTTSFKATLEVGDYEWCVIGVSGEKQTSATCRKLQIVEKP